MAQTPSKGTKRESAKKASAVSGRLSIRKVPAAPKQAQNFLEHTTYPLSLLIGGSDGEDAEKSEKRFLERLRADMEAEDIKIAELRGRFSA